MKRTSIIPHADLNAWQQNGDYTHERFGKGYRMASSFEIPIAANGRCDVRFPNRCVSCGAAATTESRIILAKLVMRKQRQVPIKVQLQVPHCQACAQATLSLFWIGLIPSLLGFLLAGGLVFVAVFVGANWLGLDTYGRPQDAPSLVLGAFFGLLAGLAGGFLAELLTRLILWPFMGHSMLRAPLLVAQLLSDGEYIPGLRATLKQDATQLQLTFENDAIASEFATQRQAAGIDPA